MSSIENVFDWKALVHRHVKHLYFVRRGEESLWSLYLCMATPTYPSLLRTIFVLCLTERLLLRAIRLILKLDVPHT
jgi:hypothetical protein